MLLVVVMFLCLLLYTEYSIFCFLSLVNFKISILKSTELLLVLFAFFFFNFLVRIACEKRTMFSPYLSDLVSNLHPYLLFVIHKVFRT